MTHICYQIMRWEKMHLKFQADEQSMKRAQTCPTSDLGGACTCGFLVWRPKKKARNSPKRLFKFISPFQLRVCVRLHLFIYFPQSNISQETNCRSRCKNSGLGWLALCEKPQALSLDLWVGPAWTPAVSFWWDLFENHQWQSSHSNTWHLPPSHLWLSCWEEMVRFPTCKAAE